MPGASPWLGTVVTAPAAEAGAYNCGGSLSRSGSVPNGTVYNYFDGTNNCSVFVKSSYVGTPTYIEFQIENSSGAFGKPDNNSFSWYAGPSSINGVGQCVREFVYVTPPPDKSGGFSLSRVGPATDQPGP